MGSLTPKAWFQIQPAKASIFSLPNRGNVSFHQWWTLAGQLAFHWEIALPGLIRCPWGCQSHCLLTSDERDVYRLKALEYLVCGCACDPLAPSKAFHDGKEESGRGREGKRGASEPGRSVPFGPLSVHTDVVNLPGMPRECPHTGLHQRKQ